MAPSRPRPSPSTQPLKSILKKPALTGTPSTRAESLFPASKKDKRAIKHAQLMSRVTKSQAKPRRRRPNKKLVTTLDSLADALPNDGDQVGNDDAGAKAADQINLIRRKSIKSKPGAMKRREKLDRSERERFAKNLAQIYGPSVSESGTASTVQGSQAPSTTSAITTSAKWAALKGFIGQTLEQRPDVKAAMG